MKARIVMVGVSGGDDLTRVRVILEDRVGIITKVVSEVELTVPGQHRTFSDHLQYAVEQELILEGFAIEGINKPTGSPSLDVPMSLHIPTPFITQGA